MPHQVLFLLSELSPEVARTLKPAGLPALIIFTMIRFNDVRADAAEIQTIMGLFQEQVFKAPMQRKNREIAVEVKLNDSKLPLASLIGRTIQSCKIVFLSFQYVSMLLSNVHILKNLLQEFSVVGTAKANNAPDWQCVTYDLGDYQVIMRKLLFHLSHVS